MPHGKINPLVNVAKEMLGEAVKFGKRYQSAENPDAVIQSLGKLHSLCGSDADLYTPITLAIGITDEVYQGCVMFFVEQLNMDIANDLD